MTTPTGICPEFPEWPRRWEIIEEDIAYGEALLEPLEAFIQSLIDRGLTKKTIRRHTGNLWLLGGEIIRDVYTEGDYEVPALQKLQEAVGPDGGPYCRHLDSEHEKDSFDATCRKLHKFLQQWADTTFHDELQPLRTWNARFGPQPITDPRFFKKGRYQTAQPSIPPSRVIK